MVLEVSRLPAERRPLDLPQLAAQRPASLVCFRAVQECSTSFLYKQKSNLLFFNSTNSTLGKGAAAGGFKKFAAGGAAAKKVVKTGKSGGLIG